MKRAAIGLLVGFVPFWWVGRLVASAAPDDDAGAGDVDAGVASPDAASTPELDELRPPTSPAFSLLGVSPTEIDRPRTPSALASSLASAVGRTVPSGLALEISPFWLFDQSELTLSDLQGDGLSSRLSSLSFSAATNKTDANAMLGLAGYTDLSLGGHVVWLRAWEKCDVRSEPLNTGALALGFDAIRAEAETTLARCEGAAEAEIEACKTSPDQQSCEAAVRQRLDECDRGVEKRVNAQRAALTQTIAAATSAADEQLAKDVEECSRKVWTPSGWVGSAAAAVAVRFASDEWDNGEYLRSAVWVTFGHEGDAATFLAVTRLRFEDVNGKGPDVLAGGLRAILHRSSFAASVEGVYNHSLVDGLDSGFRLALVGEGKIAGSWLTLSVGKDYDSLGGDAFFSLANLTVTMGDPTLKKTD